MSSHRKWREDRIRYGRRRPDGRGGVALIGLAAAVTAIVALAACSSGGGTSAPPRTSTPVEPCSVGEVGLGGRVEVLVNGLTLATVKRGEPVTLTMNVCNVRDGPVTLYYRDEQRYDFEIFSSDEPSAAAWQWSAGRAFEQAVGKEVIEPAGRLTYEEVWDLVDNEGNAVSKGRYIIRGESPHCDEELAACGLAAAAILDIE